MLDPPKQDVGFATLAAQTCINLVSRVLAHTFEFSVSRSRSSTAQSTTSGTPLGRFAGLKHRQLARQVGVIIITVRIRRTLVNKINLVARPGVSACRPARHAARCAARRRLLRLRRASGCFGTSRGSSPTTSPPPHVRVPRHVARLVA
jgi:hypothetical protein